MPSWSQSVAGMQPQSRPSGRQRAGPGSAQALGPLLCAPPLMATTGPGSFKQDPAGSTVKSRGWREQKKAVPLAERQLVGGCSAGGGWWPSGLQKGEKVLEGRVESIHEHPRRPG